jgi:hypothetical protein
MQQVCDAAEDAILGDEGAAGAASEEGVDGCMVVDMEAEEAGVAEGSQGEGFVGCEELGSLLSEDPPGAGEEA